MTFQSRHVVQAVLPTEDDGRLAEFGEVGEDPLLEFGLRGESLI
jgi:hypothetical protein